MKVFVNCEISGELKNKTETEYPEGVDLAFTTDPPETLEVAEDPKWNQTPMAGLARRILRIPEIVERGP